MTAYLDRHPRACACAVLALTILVLVLESNP